MSGSVLNALANPTVVNPLDAYGKALTVNNALNQNAVFQAKKAQGQAFANSITDDGATDQAQYMKNLKADPNAALGSVEAAQGGQTLNSADYAQRMKQLAYGAAGFGQILVDNNGTAPYDAIKAYYDRAVKDGHVSAAQEQQVLAGFGQDPVANASVGRQRMMQAISAQEALARANGTPTSVNDGQNVIPGTTNSQTGAFQPAGAAVPTYPSRADLASRTPVGVNPDGSPKYGPLAGVTPSNLAGPAAQSPLGDGRGNPMPPALRNPAAAAVPNNGVVTTGLGPAATAAQAATGAQSAGKFQEITDQGVQAQARGAVLDNMLGDTSQFTTGPLAGIKEKVRAIGTQFGIPVDTEKLSASESFNKLAANLASQQGSGSDARLSVAQAGNPHAELSPAGVDLMLRQLRGNEDYLQARAQLAAKYPKTDDRRGFEAEIGAKLDPRAFQFDRMTDPQKKTYLYSLPSDKARDAFIAAHDAKSALLGAQ